ncbi:hypothetical protein A45J_0889 [hot springs metagenome]|uniref:Uncharacterized protein n=1 Tax=hot springs metagenome TaxID=433727 RepID=A0A5J4L6H7_9ZZZZ
MNGGNIDIVILTPDTDPLLLYEIFLNGKLLCSSLPPPFQIKGHWE